MSFKCFKSAKFTSLFKLWACKIINFIKNFKLIDFKPAKEGYNTLAISFALAFLAFHFLSFVLALPFILFFLFALQFFREPPRKIVNCESDEILAPADGKVIKIERVYDPHLNRDALLISIFMNVFNVHVNYIPMDGLVEKIVYHKGKFFNAALDKASLDNESNTLCIKRADGVLISCTQVAGFIARRILSYSKEGDLVSKGERYGFIKFGSRLDVYLPLNSLPKVVLGQKVHACESILAKVMDN